MSKEKSVQASGGIGFFGLLALVFITLKLIGVSVVAKWSWWWVLSPLWAPIVAILGIAIIGVIIWGLIYLVATKFSR